MYRIWVGGITPDHDERKADVVEVQHMNNIGDEVCPQDLHYSKKEITFRNFKKRIW